MTQNMNYKWEKTNPSEEVGLTSRYIFPENILLLKSLYGYSCTYIKWHENLMRKKWNENIISINFVIFHIHPKCVYTFWGVH